MRNTEIQMDSWNIKMIRPMTLWGMITPKIEDMVARYGSMIDHAKTMARKKEIENEFVFTMYSHGIVCDCTNNAKLAAQLLG